MVQKRFNFQEGTVESYAEKVATHGPCAMAQAESLHYKLIGGLSLGKPCYGVLHFIMESGAKGCEVIASSKLKGQCPKPMKSIDGLMIHLGEPINNYKYTTVRHILLRQGMYNQGGGMYPLNMAVEPIGDYHIFGKIPILLKIC